MFWHWKGILIKQEQLHGGGRASRGKYAGDIRCLPIFYNKRITRKCLTLKTKVMVVEYNIRNGPIRWQISTSMKVIVEHYLLALAVFEILAFQNSWPWKCRSRSWRPPLAVALLDGKYLTSYLVVIVFQFPTFTCQKSNLKSLTLII